MSRTSAEHVVMMQVEYLPLPEPPKAVENDAPETPEAVGPDAEYAYVPVMGVDGKAAGLQWIMQHGIEGETYRVASFSTGPFSVGAVEKIVVKRSLIAQ